MIISIEFKPSEPTLAMWAFAQNIAKTLELKLPKYEYEEVSAFLEMYSKDFYNFRHTVNYDYWNHAFWMDECDEFEEREFYEGSINGGR